MVPRIKAGSPLCFAQAIIFTPTPPLYVLKAVKQPDIDSISRRIAAAAFALVLQVCWFRSENSFFVSLMSL